MYLLDYWTYHEILASFVFDFCLYLLPGHFNGMYVFNFFGVLQYARIARYYKYGLEIIEHCQMLGYILRDQNYMCSALIIVSCLLTTHRYRGGGACTSVEQHPVMHRHAETLYTARAKREKRQLWRQ